MSIENGLTSPEVEITEIKEEKKMTIKGKEILKEMEKMNREEKFAFLKENDIGNHDWLFIAENATGEVQRIAASIVLAQMDKIINPDDYIEKDSNEYNIGRKESLKGTGMPY